VTVLFWRALVAFVVLPGAVAFAIPLGLLAPHPVDATFDHRAWLPLAVGGALLVWCVRDFYANGKGTLAPWAPPKYLVTTGPYRVSRNPMYIAVALVLWSWATGFHSWPLATYAIVVMVAFHVRIIVNEEPFLARVHKDEWERYKARVPRWFGKGTNAFTTKVTKVDR
jgi:protein-S-isoprenylcysteine O-methyltransferase Ste14